MSSPIGISSSQITALDIQSMDLETALLAVQSNRANLLETQLKDQITAVQAKNGQVAKLNEALSLINQALGKMTSSDSQKEIGSDIADPLKNAINKALVDAGITDAGLDPGSTTVTASDGSTRTLKNYFDSRATKGELDSLVQNLKSKIDTASNSQQMDMLRLQSLTSKRNEAFDTMTNFIKKMQDSRSSIIGNMR